MMRSIEWSKLADVAVRAMALLVPRDRRLVIYGGATDRFIDNAKYLFIWHNEHMKDYRHVWLTRRDDTLKRVQRLGYSACRSDSLRGWWLQVRAGYYVADDHINHYASHNWSAGSVRINLWHGVPLKMIGWTRSDDDPPYQPKGRIWERLFAQHLHGDYCLSTHSSLNRNMSAALHFPLEHVYVGGYPRTLPLLADDRQREKMIARYETEETVDTYRDIQQREGRKIIYMPTFRDKDPNYLEKAIPDYNALNDVLRQHSTTLYLKVHRETPTPDANAYSNIIVMDNAADVYPLLPLFDALISDYSSITADFALTHRPMALYTFDLEQYIGQSRPVFQRFWDVHKKITTISSFNELKQSLACCNEWTVGDFMVADFFERPYDMDATRRLIESL